MHLFEALATVSEIEKKAGKIIGAHFLHFFPKNASFKKRDGQEIVISPFTILLNSHWSRIIIFNPSAFQNGITPENRVKIEGAMSKTMSLKLQKP